MNKVPTWKRNITEMYRFKRMINEANWQCNESKSILELKFICCNWDKKIQFQILKHENNFCELLKGNGIRCEMIHTNLSLISCWQNINLFWFNNFISILCLSFLPTPRTTKTRPTIIFSGLFGWEIFSERTGNFGPNYF